MKIFPEFYLGGFPSKMFCSSLTAYQKMCDKHTDDIVVFGYSEMDGLKFYSSAMVVDGNEYCSVRKTEPWGKIEKKIYQPWAEIPPVLKLSIGNVLVLLCNDAFEVKFGKIAYSQELWSKENLDLIIIISNWENGIEEFLINRGIKRIAKGTGCEKWILCDSFNGFFDSGNIDFEYS